MMNQFLEEIAAAIQRRDTAAIFNILLQNKTTNLSEDDIFSFLSANSRSIPISKAYTVCGSGGSMIPKPNISSLACLYLSCCQLPILKIGSSKQTSLFGSSDFFDCYGLTNKYIGNDNIQFAYYDVETVKPWFKYRHLLTMNECFRVFFENHIFNEIEYLGKFVGCLGSSKRSAYMKKESGIPKDRIHMYYSFINKSVIDEIVGDMCYVDDSRIHFQHTGSYSPLTEKDIIDIDDALLKGDCDNSLWYHSLRDTVSIALTFFKEESLSNAYREFDNIYESGGAAAIFNIQ